MDQYNEKSKCSHETAESLGFDSGTEFLRCVTCRAVIVVQNDIRLAVPPARKTG